MPKRGTAITQDMVNRVVETYSQTQDEHEIAAKLGIAHWAVRRMLQKARNDNLIQSKRQQSVIEKRREVIFHLHQQGKSLVEIVQALEAVGLGITKAGVHKAIQDARKRHDLRLVEPLPKPANKNSLKAQAPLESDAIPEEVITPSLPPKPKPRIQPLFEDPQPCFKPVNTKPPAHIPLDQRVKDPAAELRAINRKPAVPDTSMVYSGVTNGHNSMPVDYNAESMLTDRYGFTARLMDIYNPKESKTTRISKITSFTGVILARTIDSY